MLQNRFIPPTSNSASPVDMYTSFPRLMGMGAGMMPKGDDPVKPRKVKKEELSTLYKDYKEIPDRPNYFQKETMASTPPSKFASDKDWRTFMQKNSNWKPPTQTRTKDIVYIEPEKQVDPAFMSRGNNIFNRENNQAIGSLYYDLPQKSGQQQKPNAHFGYYKKGTAEIDPDRIITIPKGEWENTFMTNTINPKDLEKYNTNLASKK